MRHIYIENKVKGSSQRSAYYCKERKDFVSLLSKGRANITISLLFH